jgi:transcription elongation GreA/GreB family factor
MGELRDQGSDDGVGQADRLLTARGGRSGRNLDGKIRVGSRVRLLDQYGEVELLIVSANESEDKLTLSAHSPLGVALLDRRAGERLTVRTPLGIHFVSILSVD